MLQIKTLEMIVCKMTLIMLSSSPSNLTFNISGISTICGQHMVNLELFFINLIAHTCT